jgi:hypothetical protein
MVIVHQSVIISSRERFCKRRGRERSRSQGAQRVSRASAKTPRMYRVQILIVRLPDYKPVSVPFRAAVIHLRRPLLDGSSDLPGSRAGRAAPPPLFGLAPRGVCPAGRIAPAAVRSYRTISPLPRVAAWRYIFCGTFRRAFRPARPLAGTLPYGDRTFLPRFRERPPVRQPHSAIFAFLGVSVRGLTRKVVLT